MYLGACPHRLSLAPARRSHRCVSSCHNFTVLTQCIVPVGAPLEEHLAQSSLWPEIAKLYGHGAELFCLAASPSGDLIASACKAQTSSTAAVWLWDTKKWTAIGSLVAHGLTVTQLQFSPNGQKLLSVSRDRTFALYDRIPGGSVCCWDMRGVMS